ncbi:MAG: 3-isopropylmalate dehydratase small subunit, partial [Acidimicrobiales bacterium]
AGLVPAQVAPEAATALLAAVAADPSLEVTVDVDTRTVTAPAAGIEVPFTMDDFTRWRLLEGLDDIGLTLRHTPAIAAYESARSRLPRTV